MASTPWYDWLTPPTALNALSAKAGGPSYNGGDALGGLKNTLQGDPASATAGLNALQDKAYAQGTAIKNFLMGQKGSSMAYYKPMQQMFGNMYGTGGLAPARAPGVPGSTPLPGVPR